ncbi:MAG TPA: MipA/OmpV family protein [Usitatibacter sp.]|nr:MipA/OmpV family protein [Usitatibacter sp.]
MRLALTATAVVALLAAPSAGAADAPLWEAGIGVAGLSFPDYRGSDHSRTYALPAPYVVYRGDFFKADRHGLRGIFFKNDRIDLNMSVGASLPVDSEDDSARAGMPDLKPSVELGPSLEVNVWRAADRGAKLDLRFPVRGAFTVESHPRFIGGQFFPHANVDVADPFGMHGWNLGMLAGPVFTDSRYNRYFYEVRPEYAAPGRPAFSDTGSGYAGMQFLVALSKRFPGFWVGGFARYDTLRDAAFEASPLVTSKRYVAAGIAISWIFKESSVRVPVTDRGEAYR